METHILFLKWALFNAVYPKDTKYQSRERSYENSIPRKNDVLKGTWLVGEQPTPVF